MLCVPLFDIFPRALLWNWSEITSPVRRCAATCCREMQKPPRLRSLLTLIYWPNIFEAPAIYGVKRACVHIWKRVAQRRTRSLSISLAAATAQHHHPPREMGHTITAYMHIFTAVPRESSTPHNHARSPNDTSRSYQIRANAHTHSTVCASSASLRAIKHDCECSTAWERDRDCEANATTQFNVQLTRQMTSYVRPTNYESPGCTWLPLIIWRMWLLCVCVHVKL